MCVIYAYRYLKQERFKLQCYQKRQENLHLLNRLFPETSLHRYRGFKALFEGMFQRILSFQHFRNLKSIAYLETQNLII